MEARKELKVNVHARAINASERVNGKELLEPLQQLEAVEDVGLQNLLRGAVELTTHTNSGQKAIIRVPHSILAVLVTIALAALGAGFWVVSSITEIKVSQNEIKQSQRDIKAQQSSNLKLTTAYITNETNRVNFMTALLTPAQREQIYRWDKANPRPQLPDTNDSPDDPR